MSGKKHYTNRNRRRYKNPFRSQVIDYLSRYSDIKKIGGENAMKIIDAIDETINEISDTDEGMLKIKAVEMMYIKRTHTVEGVSIELNVDRSTVYRMVNEFVFEVCVKSKLLNNATLAH